eukprot:47470-Pelagomonas_calceolata.AAC.3
MHYLSVFKQSTQLLEQLWLNPGARIGDCRSYLWKHEGGRSLCTVKCERYSGFTSPRGNTTSAKRRFIADGRESLLKWSNSCASSWQVVKAFKSRIPEGKLGARRAFLKIYTSARASFKTLCSSSAYKMHFPRVALPSPQPVLPSSPQQTVAHHPCAESEEVTSQPMHAPVASPLKRPRSEDPHHAPPVLGIHTDPYNAPPVLGSQHLAPQHAATHPHVHAAAPKNLAVGANLSKALKSVEGRWGPEEQERLR